MSAGDLELRRRRSVGKLRACHFWVFRLAYIALPLSTSATLLPTIGRAEHRAGNEPILELVSKAESIADQKIATLSDAQRARVDRWRQSILQSKSALLACDYRSALHHAEQAGIAVFEDSGSRLQACSTAASAVRGVVHLHCGEYALADTLLERALASVRADPVFSALEEATLLQYLGRLEFELAHFDKATAHVNAAHDIRSKLLGESHPQTLSLSLDRVQILLAQGDLERAKSAIIAAKPIVKFQQEDPLLYARSLATIASFAAEIGGYAKASKLLQDALKIERDNCDKPRPTTIAMLLDLCAVECAMGELESAEAHGRQAAHDAKNLFGDKHPLCARSLREVARIALESGRIDFAVQLAAAACTIQQHVYRGTSLARGEDYELAGAIAYHNALDLVKTPADQIAHLQKARDAQERAAKVYRDCGAHLRATWVKSDLAVTYRELGELQQAANVFTAAATELLEQVPSDHPRQLRARHEFGKFLADIGDDQNAATVLRHVVDFYAKHPPFFEAEHVSTLLNLSLCKIPLEETERHLSKAIEIARKSKCPMEIQLALALSHMAYVRLSQERLDDAKKAIAESSQLIDQVLGQQNVLYASNLCAHGDIAFAEGEYLEATTFFERALAALTPIVGDSALELVPCLQGYARAMRELGEEETYEKMQERARAIIAASPGPSRASWRVYY